MHSSGGAIAGTDTDDLQLYRRRETDGEQDASYYTALRLVLWWLWSFYHPGDTIGNETRSVVGKWLPSDFRTFLAVGICLDDDIHIHAGIANDEPSAAEAERGPEAEGTAV